MTRPSSAGTVPAFRIAAALLFAACGGARAQQVDPAWFCEPRGEMSSVRWTETGLGPQKTLVVGDTAADPGSTLVIFLHGDSPFGDPVYQYDIARDIAGSRMATVAASILRPGYRDTCGDRSAGDAGRKMGDNYTATVVASIAATIADLQNDIAPARTIVVGHSGGAALAALLAASHPGLQDRSILVACPCDLAAWRQSMATLMDNDTWLEPMPGLSPLDAIAAVPAGLGVDLWVGADDRVTPPFLSERFREWARAQGKEVSLKVVAGGDHDMILVPDVLNRILASMPD